MGTFHQAWWPTPRNRHTLTSAGSSSASPAPAKTNRQCPLSLTLSPPASLTFPRPTPCLKQDRRPRMQAASQRERLRNNLIASNYKQPRSPRSADAKFNRMFPHHQGGGRNSSALQIKQDFPDRRAVSWGETKV